MPQVAGAENAIPHCRGGLLPQKSSVILGTQAILSTGASAPLSTSGKLLGSSAQGKSSVEVLLEILL
jgi:hypothetical protein